MCSRVGVVLAIVVPATVAAAPAVLQSSLASHHQYLHLPLSLAHSTAPCLYIHARPLSGQLFSAAPPPRLFLSACPNFSLLLVPHLLLTSPPSPPIHTHIHTLRASRPAAERNLSAHTSLSLPPPPLLLLAREPGPWSSSSPRNYLGPLFLPSSSCSSLDQGEEGGQEARTEQERNRRMV
jgi:hypothetical protein